MRRPATSAPPAVLAAAGLCGVCAQGRRRWPGRLGIEFALPIVAEAGKLRGNGRCWKPS
jgi:hypothetical protein